MLWYLISAFITSVGRDWLSNVVDPRLNVTPDDLASSRHVASSFRGGSKCSRAVAML